MILPNWADDSPLEIAREKADLDFVAVLQVESILAEEPDLSGGALLDALRNRARASAATARQLSQQDLLAAS